LQTTSYRMRLAEHAVAVAWFSISCTAVVQGCITTCTTCGRACDTWCSAPRREFVESSLPEFDAIKAKALP